VTDLLIRNTAPQLKRQIAKRARQSGQSLSDEVKSLIRRGLSAPNPTMEFGTWLFSSVDEKDRGDDLVFEVPGNGRRL
jgi:hypothetical protein